MCRAFPSCQNVAELHIKFADSEDILGQCPLPISKWYSLRCGDAYRQVCTIQGANAALKEAVFIVLRGRGIPRSKGVVGGGGRFDDVLM